MLINCFRLDQERRIGAYRSDQYANDAGAASSLLNDFIGPVMFDVSDSKEGESRAVFILVEHDPTIKESWADLDQAAERGAIALSMIECHRSRSLSKVSQLRKGEGFDYVMGPDLEDSGESTKWLNTQRTYLEISGIHGETKTRDRVQEKWSRPSAQSLANERRIVSVANFRERLLMISEKP